MMLQMCYKVEVNDNGEKPATNSEELLSRFLELPSLRDQVDIDIWGGGVAASHNMLFPVTDPEKRS